MTPWCGAPLPVMGCGLCLWRSRCEFGVMSWVLTSGLVGFFKRIFLAGRFGAEVLRGLGFSGKIYRRGFDCIFGGDA